MFQSFVKQGKHKNDDVYSKVLIQVIGVFAFQSANTNRFTFDLSHYGGRFQTGKNQIISAAMELGWSSDKYWSVVCFVCLFM